MTVDAGTGRSAQELQTVLPVYLVVDESYSMSVELDQISRALVETVDLLRANALATATVRLAVIGFSDEAVVRMPLCDLATISVTPTLQPRGGTAYRPVLDLLRSSIDSDVASLKADGLRVLRPTVIFITDGQPTDPGWEATKFLEPEWRFAPNVLAFCTDESTATGLLLLVGRRGRVFRTANDHVSFGTVTARLMRQLFVSLSSSVVGAAPHPDAKSGLSFEIPGDLIPVTPHETL